MFVSTNNGGLWKAIDSGLTNLVIKALAISGNNILLGLKWWYIFLFKQW